MSDGELRDYWSCPYDEDAYHQATILDPFVNTLANLQREEREPEFDEINSCSQIEEVPRYTNLGVLQPGTICNDENAGGDNCLSSLLGHDEESNYTNVLDSSTGSYEDYNDISFQHPQLVPNTDITQTQPDVVSLPPIEFDVEEAIHNISSQTHPMNIKEPSHYNTTPWPQEVYAPASSMVEEPCFSSCNYGRNIDTGYKKVNKECKGRVWFTTNSTPHRPQNVHNHCWPQTTPCESGCEGCIKKRRRGNHLYRFLIELLQTDAHSDIIDWENRPQGIFRFKNSAKVAHLWGSRKNNAKMTFEYMARAMRFYYKKKILSRVPEKGRLVYQFGPHADEFWNR